MTSRPTGTRLLPVPSSGVTWAFAPALRTLALAREENGLPLRQAMTP
ncbi:hypothetical protein HUO13_34340 [Saccharopolyspora erythraea]|nr:hypothetical protein [Saccharopolyspora erythraea]QUH05182.1 hypothetical protein HUO13_34340 [Saccharopolyspora erythraea]